MPKSILLMRIKGQDCALSGLAPGCLSLPGGYALPLTYHAPLGLVGSLPGAIV